MSAKCGPLGPMICLNHASCNETSGLCESCPKGYSDDETIFIGNQNCGLDQTAIVVVYALATCFALLICIMAMKTALVRKPSRMKNLLFLVAFWLFVLPFYLLAHYLNGYRHGIVGTLLFITVCMLVNTQVCYFSYVIENFLTLVMSNGMLSKRNTLWKFHLTWYLFWMLTKLICGLVMLAGLSDQKNNIFNGGMVTIACSLIIEISFNVIRANLVGRKLVKAVNEFHSSMQSTTTTGINPVVLDFAKRVQSTLFVGPLYFSLSLAAGVACPVLFVLFDSSVPYSFVIWSILVLLWPIIGLGPIVLMQSKLGRHMEGGSGGEGVKMSGGTSSPHVVDTHVLSPAAVAS